MQTKFKQVHNKSKRTTAMLLAIAMVLSIVPVSVFAEETDTPFTAITTSDGKSVKVIKQDAVTFTGYSAYEDVPYYHIQIPEGTEAVNVTYPAGTGVYVGTDMYTGEAQVYGYYAETEGWTGDGANCDYIVNDDGSVTAVIPVTMMASDFMTGAEVALDFTDGYAFSVEYASDFSPVNFFTFEYVDSVEEPEQPDEPEIPVVPEQCLGVSENAPTEVSVGAGGLYELMFTSVFEDSDSHDMTYSFRIAEDGYDTTHTKMANGKFYFCAPTEGEVYNVTLSAECSDGKTVSHNLEITVTKANEGIAAQYGYDETDKSSVTVYVTLSNDGMPVTAVDGTVMSNLKVTVPYFDLGLYGYESLYRYGTENGRGPYINDTVVERPTGLHLYIYLLERYYMGLDEDKCGLGTSGIFSYAADTEVYYMDGGLAYESEGKQAIYTSAGAMSLYMVNFWGHDENLMYFRNHCYPYMSPGWGSTSDYILLSDGDTWDVGMFSNWNFQNAGGGFVRFDKDEYTVNAGETITVETLKWGTTSSSVDFEVVNGDVGLSAGLYDSEWNLIKELGYSEANKINVNIPANTADGIYYIMAMDPDVCTSDAKYAPATARIVVGEVEDEENTEVNRILLDTYSAEIDTQDTLQLTASVIPAEATNATLTWTSSDETVATVDKNGLVTPVAAGKTTITVTSENGKNASCEVTVTRYNTAPSVVGSPDTTLKVKVGSSTEFDVASYFTDAQNDELIYSVAVKEATSLGGSWDYNYTAINGADTSITDGKFTYTPAEKGIYQVVITADDGMDKTSVAFQFTVVDNDAGTITLEGGAVADIFNVVVVDHSVEFVEDVALPHKGTHDAYVHNIVLSKDTVPGTPNRKWDMMLDTNTVWSQYDNGSSAAGRDTVFSTRADFAFFVYDTANNEKYVHYFQFTTECQECAGDENKDHRCDVCTKVLSECADADNDDECDICGKYIVTINVGPSTANVTFYSGSDTETKLTAEAVKDNGVVDGYHQYILTVPEGIYTYRGTDGETNIGGMTFKVPFDEEIMSDGTASGEGMSMALRRVNYYTTNSNIKAVGDYTLRLIPSLLPDVVNGEQYIDSNNRVVTPVLVMARGNALIYQRSIAVNGELGESYAVAPVNNVSFSQSKSAQTSTFSLSAIVYHAVKAPEGAKVQVFNQLNNFNVEEITTKTVSEADENGMVIHTFKTSGGNNLTYRVSMEGKITRAGYFAGSAETISVSFEENEDPKTTVHQLDNATIQKRMEASTLLNVNAQNNLRIDKDETFRLRGYRGAWQIINTDTMNIMIEPDFHYNIISGAEHISVDVVDDVCTGNATGNWLDITGVSEGTAIIEITYDAIQIGGNGTSYDGLYGATDPQRKGLVVIQVGAGENTLQMTAEGGSAVWDVEFDTVYFMDETGSITFTATMGEDVPEKAELSVDNGKTWTDVTFADGKFTAEGLVGGNNIIRFTKGDVVEYQIVRAAKVTRTVKNLTRAEGIIAGDQLEVVYHGLYLPQPKFSGIYNPGFGDANAHKIAYTVPEGYTVTSSGSQYDFINNHSYTITVPETATGEVTFTDGCVTFINMGSVQGAHRELTDAGCGANMSASGTGTARRGILPDLTFTVIEMPYVDVTVESDTEGTSIVVKDMAGTELKAENGVYKLSLGKYRYEASLEGYIPEYKTFDVTLKDADNKTKTVSISMRKVEGAVWDGKTTTTPQKDANGVYQIGTGAELAWFASSHGDANAVLTADISLGGFNWTPIKAYKGTFDGNGHWVTDLYINASADKQALFAQLSGGGEIRNLGVSGQVTSKDKKYVAGIVGDMRPNTLIDSCISDVMVTGKQYIGGIAGQQMVSGANLIQIKNCYNLGVITSTNSGKSGYAGGISGGYSSDSNKIVVENCYNLGVVTATKSYGGIVPGEKANVVNSYYVGSNGDSKHGTEKTADELKAMAETLGEAYAEDANNINGGFPILTWQVTEAEDEVVYGDIDGDGNINMIDVSLALQYVNGSELAEEQAEACDVDGDGNVNMIDVSLILQYVNGTIEKLPVED